MTLITKTRNTGISHPEPFPETEKCNYELYPQRERSTGQFEFHTQEGPWTFEADFVTKEEESKVLCENTRNESAWVAQSVSVCLWLRS